MATAPASSPASARRVVICGGGIVEKSSPATSATSATHATSATVPTLVEKSSPAYAASGKAGGFLALDWSDSNPAFSKLARASFALHRHLAASLDGAAAYGFRPVHTLSVCLPSQPDPEPASLHPLLPSWVDPSASAASPRVLGTPETTAQVHPGLFTKAVLAASGAGVRDRI